MKKPTDRSRLILDAALSAARDEEPMSPGEGFEQRVMTSVRRVAADSREAWGGETLVSLWRRCVLVSIATAGAATCVVLLSASGSGMFDDVLYSLNPLMLQELNF